MIDIERAIETLKDMKGVFDTRSHKQHSLSALDLAIAALEKNLTKNCSRCVDRNRCAIHDNFNIDYCSDRRNEDE